MGNQSDLSGTSKVSVRAATDQPAPHQLAECISFALRTEAPANLETSPKKGFLVTTVGNMIVKQFHKSVSAIPRDFFLEGGKKKANITNSPAVS